MAIINGLVLEEMKDTTINQQAQTPLTTILDDATAVEDSNTTTGSARNVNNSPFSWFC